MGASIDIDRELVSRLIRSQFPEWRDLEVEPVPVDGWDNRSFRLGDSLSVRLPSAEGYALQVEKEARWLPVIAEGVSLPVPEVVALGVPGDGYPFPWSVRRWIEGVPVRDAPGLDRQALAIDLGSFLRELADVDVRDAPGPGAHSAGRGGPLSRFDAELDGAIARLGPRLDAARARAVWAEARATVDAGPPRWFHGDVAVGNLLTRDGRLSAVIDFGCAGVGDPACDLVIAWTSLDPASRETFRATIGADDPIWARGTGWALWKALITADDGAAGELARTTLAQLDIALAPRDVSIPA
jgi:aminoglycoside phosphotransferase (APT) family kinase protein